MATGDEKLIADVLGPHVPALGALVDQVSGPIRQGRQLYREITQQEIDPLRASSVGRMAPPKGKFDPSQPGDAEKAVGVIAKGTDVDEIRQLHTHLNAQNPQAFPAVARGLLETTFEKATKPTLEGENVKMGAKWANDLRGKDQQRANFDEILRGVAAAHGVPADQLVQGTNVLFDVLKATGKIPGVGSPTAGRIASGAELSRNPITAAAETLSTQPATAVGRWAKDVYFGRRNAELAQWFTDPDTVQILVKMAKLKPDGVTARYYLGQLLNLNKEVNTTDRQ
jgi:hypothetical protein